MNGRQFLDLAREVATGATELHWRGSAIHTYYALLLECRDVQIRWGLPIPHRHNLHATVRLRFQYATERTPKRIGDFLERLVNLRNLASYELSTRIEFQNSQAAIRAIQMANDALALLDAIEADPARRVAAIASIRP